MTHEKESEEPAQEKDTARLEAFSDGVFAFAITLLALELKIPHFHESDGEPTPTWLAHALSKQWSSYFAFATSFVTILIMWTHHHTLFRLVRRSDLRLQFANGLLLLLVTTVSFPTAIVAEYITTPAAPAAAMLYVGQQVLLSVAFLILLLVGFRPASLSKDAPPNRVRRLRRSYLIGPIPYLAALAIAPFCPKIAIGISLALWVFWALVPA